MINIAATAKLWVSLVGASAFVYGLQNLPVVCRVELKELKIRPNTDVHDYQVRLRSAAKFISKVRILHTWTHGVRSSCCQRCQNVCRGGCLSWI